MNVFVIDISGRVVNYDISLCEALSKDKNVDLLFLCPLYDEKPQCKTAKLANFIPKRYKAVESLWKRALKLCELIYNYLFVMLKVFRDNPDVIHFQWFPLLDALSTERYVVKLMQFCSPQTKMILTIHNVYPHDFSEDKKRSYASRFKKMSLLIDGFIVHTKKTKRDVVEEFGINEDSIYVVHHGIFEPKGYNVMCSKPTGSKLNLIMYGIMSQYKGVDLLVDAVSILPEEYKKRLEVVIAGSFTDKELYERLIKKGMNLPIKWYPYFLSDEELYKRIDDSDAIVIPYRQISQSGVLLLALYFNKYIITSDLPSFKETLAGFSDDMFFESGSYTSLADLIKKYIDKKVDTNNEKKVIEALNQQYSWGKAAGKSIQVYEKLMQQ